jgi:sulfatase modifying factor 1
MAGARNPSAMRARERLAPAAYVAAVDIAGYNSRWPMMSTGWRAVVAALGICGAAGACASLSGLTGGTVDDDAGRPDAPGADSASDSTDGDAGGPDAPRGDSASDATPTAPNEAGMDGGSSCEAGAQRCSGGSLEACTDAGVWGDSYPCATGTCVDASCAGSTTVGTSCTDNGDGLSNCGSTQESCCTSLEVSGGSYYRTYDPLGPDGGPTLAADGGPAGEADPATISGFRLDKYLVTVARFRAFVAAVNGDGGMPYLPAPGSGLHSHLNGGRGLANATVPGAYEQGWSASDDSRVAPTTANLLCNGADETWSPVPGNGDAKPVNCVDWAEAYAFCIWDGGFLPSEAEWEYVAAGGGQQREYPWGSAPPGSANEYAIYGCFFPSGAGVCAQDPSVVAPVGTATMGASRWGQLDMAGEVDEWTLDWYGSPYVVPCNDCAYVTAASGRVSRGGYFDSYDDPASNLLPPTRQHTVPTLRAGALGFRCARAP